MTLTRKVAYNTIVQIIGKIVTTTFSLALVVVLTNYLGVVGYGEYTTIFAYVGFFSVFADLGLYMISVREISKNENDTEKIVGNLLIIRITLAAIIFSSAAIISLFMPYSVTIKNGIILASVAIAFVTITQAFTTIFQAKLKMHFFVITDIIGRLSVLGLTLFFIQAQKGVVYVVLAYILGDLINLIIAFFLANRLVKIRPQFDWAISKKLLQYSIPLGIAGILGMIQFKIDTLFLSFLPLKGGLSNMHEVGIYGVSYKIVEVLVTFPSMFIGSVFPILSNYLSNNNEKAKDVFQKALDFLIIVALPMIVGTLILSPKIITTISGSSFILASNALRILIFAVAFSFIGNLFSHVIISANLQKKLIYVTLSASIFNIITNLIFIPYFSYMAAAINTVITELLIVILTFRIIYKNMGIKPSYKLLSRALLASVFMGAFVFFIDKLVSGFWPKEKLYQLIIFLIIVVLSVLIYFFFAYLLRAISKEDVKKIFISKNE